MRYTHLLATLMFAANFAGAQAPGDDALQRAQRRAGAAYGELQSTEYETKRVEQEYRQADADYKAAQKRADEIKQTAAAAQKKLEAARVRESAARKNYDAAVEAVDKISRPAATTR